MIRVFISQPMKGKTPNEIMDVRIKASESVKRHFGAREVEIIDSYFKDVSDVPNEPLYNLGRSLMLLATADVAYFAKGWEQARGCKIENTCAIEYGIDVIEDYTD